MYYICIHCFSLVKVLSSTLSRLTLEHHRCPESKEPGSEDHSLQCGSGGSESLCHLSSDVHQVGNGSGPHPALQAPEPGLLPSARGGRRLTLPVALKLENGELGRVSAPA